MAAMPKAIPIIRRQLKRPSLTVCPFASPAEGQLAARGGNLGGSKARARTMRTLAGFGGCMIHRAANRSTYTNFWYVLMPLSKGGTHAPKYLCSLGDHFAGFIDMQVQTGRYGSASDVVCAGLRLLEEHEAKVRALQSALVAGEESGAPVAFDSTAFLSRMRAEHVM